MTQAKQIDMLEERLDSQTELAIVMVAGTEMVMQALKDLQASGQDKFSIVPILHFVEGLNATFSGNLKAAELFMKDYEAVRDAKNASQQGTDWREPIQRGFSA